MKTVILFLLTGILFLSSPAGYAQYPGESRKQRADITIGVSLNTNEHTLDGWETVVYTNNAPDTLHYIWFHIWANAFKNDRTAFSEALLRADRTDFYFSGKDQKGYINQLDFKVNGIAADTENDPNHIDIIKIILPEPLPPGQAARISTPFHIQLPYNFLNNGYREQQYRVAQWFPKPAIYDNKGWHVMPYTAQKEDRTEAGDYQVTISVPPGYKVFPEDIDAVEVVSDNSANGTTYVYHEKNRTDFIWEAHKDMPASPVKPGPPTAKTIQENSTARLNRMWKNIQVKLFDTSRHRSLSLLPLAGYNLYDGIMAGGIVHNYQAAETRLRFLAIPLYGFKSNGLNGLGRIAYTLSPESTHTTIKAGLAVSRFSWNQTVANATPQAFMHFVKLAPFVRFTLKEKDPFSKLNRFLELKYFYLAEESPVYKEVVNGTETILTADISTSHTTITQLRIGAENSRKLYPYSGVFAMEKHPNFIRAGFTGHYYFNFANNINGLNVRFFAGKLFYTRRTSDLQRFLDSRYHLNLSGPNGEEDYTFSNYFAGRNEFEGWASQQIMMRDGGFKVRTDLLSDKVGKTDNWLSTVNFSTWFPDKINPLNVLPVKIPLKLFADIGTYAEAWNQEAETDRFLFDAGFQLSLFKETLNIYFPVIYSRVFKNYYKSSLGDHQFWKTISFSIDLQQINLKKLTGLTSL